jgi:hypothetical protein
MSSFLLLEYSGCLIDLQHLKQIQEWLYGQTYKLYSLLLAESLLNKTRQLSSTRITFTIIDIGTLNPLEANRTYYKTLVSKFGCHKVSSADRKSQICMINVLSTFKKLEKLLNLFTDQDYQISFAVLA